MRSVVKRLRDAFDEETFTPAQAAKVLGCDPRSVQRSLPELAERDQVYVVSAAKGPKPGLWSFAKPKEKDAGNV
jgi:hypothetical protein